MEAQVLVLDSSFQPTHRTSWQVVMGWLVKRTVEVVDEYPDIQVRSANWSPQLPSVVRLLKPVKKRRAVKFSRHGVYSRDGGRCQYCGRRVSLEEMTYDHVLPRAQGGKTEWTNVVVCCQLDNQRKAGRTPEQAGMALRSHPVKPKFLSTPVREIAWKPGMPQGWRAFLRDAVYWDGELEQD